MLSRLSSYVTSYYYIISNHHTIRKELFHVVLHTAISTLGVYQDSRSWRNTSILSDLALYLLFICNGRKVCLLRTSPTVNIFITSQPLSHKCSFHMKPCHCTDNTKKVDDSKALRYNIMSPRDPICAARLFLTSISWSQYSRNSSLI